MHLRPVWGFCGGRNLLEALTPESVMRRRWQPAGCSKVGLPLTTVSVLAGFEHPFCSELMLWRVAYGLVSLTNDFVGLARTQHRISATTGKAVVSSAQRGAEQHQLFVDLSSMVPVIMSGPRRRTSSPEGTSTNDHKTLFMGHHDDASPHASTAVQIENPMWLPPVVANVWVPTSSLESSRGEGSLREAGTRSKLATALLPHVKRASPSA
jgi:hypothetical protein